MYTYTVAGMIVFEHYNTIGCVSFVRADKRHITNTFLAHSTYYFMYAVRGMTNSTQKQWNTNNKLERKIE